MEVLFIFVVGIGAGLLVILLIAATAPRPPPVDLKQESGGSPFVELDSEQLSRLVVLLLEKMGLEIERIQGGKNEVVEIRANNPAPIVGGSLLVSCMAAPEDTGKVDGRRVQSFLRSVRTAYVSKGLLFTAGTFTADGRLAAEDTPIELFDRHQIERLLDQHFPDRDRALALPELISALGRPEKSAT